MTPVTNQVQTLQDAFVCLRTPWYERVVDSVVPSASDEDNLLDVVQEEMAQFYDVVKEREFANIRKKYASARTVMYKIAEKVQEMDK